MKNDIYIGIDVGVNTGLAIWDARKKKFVRIVTKNIVWSMEEVKTLINDVYFNLNVLVLIEDPNRRKWFGNTGRERLQGAGSVKRDYSIWVEFCEHNGINYESVAPKSNKTKTSSEYFNKLTGWEGRTSAHSRDAAMMIFGL